MANARDLPDVKQIVREPRGDEVAGADRTKRGMLMRRLQIERGQISQPCDGGLPLVQEVSQRCGHFLFVVTAERNPSLGVDGRPNGIRPRECEVEPAAKVFALFIRQVIQNLQEGPLVGRRLPANWTREDFYRALRLGLRPDGSSIDPSMPWKLTAHMTDTELDALWSYFQSLPAISEDE